MGIPKFNKCACKEPIENDQKPRERMGTCAAPRRALPRVLRCVARLHADSIILKLICKQLGIQDPPTYKKHKKTCGPIRNTYQSSRDRVKTTHRNSIGQPSENHTSITGNLQKAIRNSQDCIRKI